MSNYSDHYGKQCSVGGCVKLAESRGMCKNHHAAWMYEQKKDDPEFLAKKRARQQRYRDRNKDKVNARRRQQRPSISRRDDVQQQIQTPAEEVAMASTPEPDIDMSRELLTKMVPVVAERWGPSWEEMMSTAEKLGERGVMFEIKWVTPEQERRGVDILPELILYDYRYRKTTVTAGLWIVLHPGKSNFRVLTNEQIEYEYRDVS